MTIENKAVLATTTRADYSERYKRVRTDLALRTISDATSHGYPIVVVDRGSPDKYIYDIMDCGGTVYHQEGPTMGDGRRQALQLATVKNNPVIWLEPEKYPLIPLIQPAIDKITEEHRDMVMFNRHDLDSYPPEEAHMYQMCGILFNYLTGISCDFLFGPVALSNKGVDYFLRYKSPYGDKWDAIHIPKLHIMHDNLPWSQVLVDFKYPPEQREAEQGHTGLFMKRIEQLHQVSQALIQETSEYNIRNQPSAELVVPV